MVEPDLNDLSLVRQCELLGLTRSMYYYRPRPTSEKDLRCTRLMDEFFTKHPYFGSRRLRDELVKAGQGICRDHVRRLMRLMGLEAIYPKKRLSLQNKEHKVYPYLLGGLAIVRPDQVWCSDITYIRLKRGFGYLVAVMDWFSRYILAWELSLSLESLFCVSSVEAALEVSRPEIFNTDQGCQYTSEDFTRVLKVAQVDISMNGKGRAFDNIMIERLWRTVKYEEVYLKDYGHVFEARENLAGYFSFYNEERGHSSLKGRTPSAAYWEGRARTTLAKGVACDCNSASGYALRFVAVTITNTGDQP